MAEVRTFFKTNDDQLFMDASGAGSAADEIPKGDGYIRPTSLQSSEQQAVAPCDGISALSALWCQVLRVISYL
jgi:hypothetical protein